MPKAKKPAAKKPARKAAAPVEFIEDEKGNLRTGNIKFPEGQVFWPAVFKAVQTYNTRFKKGGQGEAGTADYEYKVELRFSKSNPEIKKWMKLFPDMLKKAYGGALKSKSIYYPVKDGDEKYDKDPEKYEEYKDTWYIALSSPADKQPPVVRDMDGEPFVNNSEFYAGCMARAVIALSTYNTPTASGVKAYFTGIQKTGDGEKIGFDKSKAFDNAKDVTL